MLGRMQSAVRSRRRCGAEKCTAAIQYLLELWSTAAPESGKLWAEDKIIWFMMGRYKVTARKVETMTGGRLCSGLNAVFTSLSKASVKPLIMSVLFCFHLTHCPFLCRASLHHHQPV